MRASAHTDYGIITILKTDYPGLQVSKDTTPPTWINVPFVENAYIINLGDLMARWTGDLWLSTLHRVITPDKLQSQTCKNPSANGCEDGQEEAEEESTRRQSMAFFFNVNRDAVIETLDIEGRLRVFEPVVAGDFLLMKHLAATMK